MIAEKGLDISKLNWENSFKVLKNKICEKVEDIENGKIEL